MSNVPSPKTDLRSRIEHVDSLPPLPEIAERLLALQQRSAAGARDLAAIIELDPSLAGQVLRYAASPVLGCREKILSINEAVTRLGFDNVLHMALGFAAGQGFKIPPNGPLGLRTFWRHAVYTAALMQHLAGHLRTGHVEPGLAYLGGLLHNIGFLLLGHLFPTEFNLLNQVIEKHAEQRVIDLEAKHLGMNHSQTGVWLMRKWRMPAEIVTTVYEHHNPDYRGEHHEYANLALIADTLVKTKGLGDANSTGLPERLLQNLGFTEESVMSLSETVMENAADLELLADNLSQAG